MSNAYYIGLLSGTSIDNIDAALIDFKNDDSPTLVATHAHPIPAPLKAETLLLAQKGNTHLKQVGELDAKWGHLFAQSVLALLGKVAIPPSQIQAIGSHGQTLWHHPKGDYPFTLQIGDPHIIAKKTGILTIADFRRSDMAMGGQGAPLAPGFHQHYFQTPDIDRVVVNLGGIANISYLPKDKAQPIIGYDTGPANTLLDSWCLMHRNRPFDENGKWAQTGVIQFPLLERLLSDPYFEKSYPKSTGKDYFNINFITNILDVTLYNIEPPYQPEDVQATLVELTAISLCHEIKKLPISETLPFEMILCGGGAHNRFLKSRIQTHLGDRAIVIKSDDRGIKADWVEAVLFAWLAKANAEETVLDYTHITGASKPTLLGIRCLA